MEGMKSMKVCVIDIAAIKITNVIAETDEKELKDETRIAAMRFI